MPRAYLVSDIHITSPESARARLFVAFLRSLSGQSNITHLFLLGDIFDLWVADHRYFLQRYHEIIDEIRRLKAEGVAVSFFEGNHDLHLRYFWADRLGITVCEGPTYVCLGERQVRLEHGDQMDPDDTGYLFLRWLLRTAPVRLLLRWLPGVFISWLGDRASEKSRQYTSNTKTIAPDDAVAKIRAHAQKVHAENPFDLIISGHVHVRDDCWLASAMGEFRSVNLGSWLHEPCYFLIDDTRARFFDIVESGEQQPGSAFEKLQKVS